MNADKPRILVTGAAGFVGARVLRRLARRGFEGHLLTHDTPVSTPTHWTEHRGDLASWAPPALGADLVLIHLAHRLHGSFRDLDDVNRVGIDRLLCGLPGLTRVISLGTAAVYGPGPLRCARAEELVAQPRSATSCTRLAGDALVLESGGTVFRPHFVFGSGDRWFEPRLLQIVGEVGWIRGMEARHTLTDVEILADAVVEAAADPRRDPGGVVLCGTESPAMRAFARARMRMRGIPEPTRTVGRDVALEATARAGDPRWSRDVMDLTSERTFEVEAFERLIGQSAVGREFTQSGTGS